jgi:hypothetical protein
LAVAILSLALLHAATCSATCAICLGSSATSTTTATAAAAQSNACEHAAPDAAGGAQKRCPAKPDCFAHHHSGFEFVQSNAVMQFRLSTTRHASPLVDGAGSTEAWNLVSSFLSDLAPPRRATVSPQQKTFILRI